ncbi:hypothetical protein LUZ60_009612 [Juncus effusus]|nr:hypothetical protein LUZ60_009612 [Juncus effusus]
MAGGTVRTLLSISSSSSSLFPRFTSTLSLRRTFCLAAVASPPSAPPSPPKHAVLLDRIRSRHLKDSVPSIKPFKGQNGDAEMKNKKNKMVGSFEELGLEKEVLASLEEMGIQKPTEIQCIGIPAVIQGKSVVMGSHTGSGKTLAYLLPLVQLMRRDEALSGLMMKPRRPRAVVLCPTRELTEQVYRVAKSISHHARFRSMMVSGGVRLRPQEDSLNSPIDLVVGTPGRILQHIQDGNMVYGDIKYVVLDEADTMFDQGFGPDIRKFLAPLKKRSSKPGDLGFQTVLVTATMTNAVQKLVDEEFEGIIHLRTSSFQKKIASARHDFIKVAGSENKLESLLQVLEPSLSKGNRVMVFCNTLNSSRAVDHFLGESQISTVNYHGEVPAEERVENLKKFKSEGDCPTLVCTDLAARGLDLDVDHVIMFDFPLNSIDYLHRTGRTARMGAKGKVTSLVAKRDISLATRIEDAIKRNESLEALNVQSVRKEGPTTKTAPKFAQNGKNSKIVRANTSTQKGKFSSGSQKGKFSSGTGTVLKKSSKFVVKKDKEVSAKSRESFKSKPNSNSYSKSKPFSGGGVKETKNRKPFESRKVEVGGKRGGTKSGTKFKVVGFTGRNSGRSAQKY